MRVCVCEHVRAYERDRESERDFNKAAQTHTRPQNFLHYAVQDLLLTVAIVAILLRTAADGKP